MHKHSFKHWLGTAAMAASSGEAMVRSGMRTSVCVRADS